MNSKLFFSVALLSIAFTFVVSLDPSALIVVLQGESQVLTIPITKSTVDTKSFLETVEATTSPIDTTPPVVSVPEDIIAEATGPGAE